MIFFRSGMVKNLLNSGHTVTVWNRTTEKVRDFLEGKPKNFVGYELIPVFSWSQGGLDT